MIEGIGGADEDRTHDLLNAISREPCSERVFTYHAVPFPLVDRSAACHTVLPSATGSAVRVAVKFTLRRPSPSLAPHPRASKASRERRYPS
jgi:hypothetical protein